MRTRYVTSLPLDADALAVDLDRSRSFRWSEAYSDYLIGAPWKSCMLWAVGGDAGDGVVTNYPYGERAAFTGYGDRVPYLRQLISDIADLDRLNFARLAPVSDTVFIPHRDLLELGDLPDESRNAHRVHVVLATNDDCFFSEDNTVYRMRRGDVWFLDAAQIHSVAVLSQVPRVHMILDFVGTGDPATLLRLVDAGVALPPDRVVERPPLPADRWAALQRLGDVLTVDTFYEVFAVLIKAFFRFDTGAGFVWDTMTELAARCADPAVLAHTLELRRHYTLERSAEETAVGGRGDVLLRAGR